MHCIRLVRAGDESRGKTNARSMEKATLTRFHAEPFMILFYVTWAFPLSLKGYQPPNSVVLADACFKRGA